MNDPVWLIYIAEVESQNPVLPDGFQTKTCLFEHFTNDAFLRSLALRQLPARSIDPTYSEALFLLQQQSSTVSKYPADCALNRQSRLPTTSSCSRCDLAFGFSAVSFTKVVGKALVYIRSVLMDI